MRGADANYFRCATCGAYVTATLPCCPACGRVNPARAAAGVSGGVSCELPLHDEIINYCNGRGWLALHARTDQKSTIMVGWPDFTVFTDHGIIYLIEVKRKNGKLRPSQINTKAWLERLGHPVHVVHSMDEFKAVVTPVRNQDAL